MIRLDSSHDTIPLMKEESAGRHILGRQKLLLIAVGIIAGILIAGGIVFWHAHQRQSLLPEEFTAQSVPFQRYFYFDSIPAGYTLDGPSSRYSGGVLLVSLTKPQQPPVVITEQKLAENMGIESLMEGGEKITGTAVPAVINTVEGRLVGILADKDGKTLILLNTSSNTDKQALRALIQGLKPLR